MRMIKTGVQCIISQILLVCQMLTTKQANKQSSFLPHSYYVHQILFLPQSFECFVPYFDSISLVSFNSEIVAFNSESESVLLPNKQTSAGSTTVFAKAHSAPSKVDSRVDSCNISIKSCIKSGFSTSGEVARVSSQFWVLFQLMVNLSALMWELRKARTKGRKSSLVSGCSTPNQ